MATPRRLPHLILAPASHPPAEGRAVDPEHDADLAERGPLSSLQPRRLHRRTPRDPLRTAPVALRRGASPGDAAARARLYDPAHALDVPHQRPRRRRLRTRFLDLRFFLAPF